MVDELLSFLKTTAIMIPVGACLRRKLPIGKGHQVSNPTAGKTLNDEMF